MQEKKQPYPKQNPRKTPVVPGSRCLCLMFLCVPTDVILIFTMYFSEYVLHCLAWSCGLLMPLECGRKQF